MDISETSAMVKTSKSIHALFGECHSALVLHGYYDDFEVTNPLGSKTAKHKLGTVHIVLYISFHFDIPNVSEVKTEALTIEYPANS